MGCKLVQQTTTQWLARSCLGIVLSLFFVTGGCHSPTDDKTETSWPVGEEQALQARAHLLLEQVALRY